MTTKIRDAITYMQEHGVPLGSRGPHDQLCTLNALVSCHNDGNWLQQKDTEHFPDFRADELAIAYVLHEQYPNTAYDYKVRDVGMAIVKFHDDCARAGKEEELFTILEKAALRREEEI